MVAARLIAALIPFAGLRRRLRNRLLEWERRRRLRRAIPVVRERYSRHLARLADAMRRGERIRVCFLVCDAAMFSAESVYLELRRDAAFACFIAVVPRISRGAAFMRETYAKTLSLLEGRYGGAVRGLFDPATGGYTSLEGRADVVFTSVVYDNQIDTRFLAEAVSAYALTACVSYGYSGQLAADTRRLARLPQPTLFWRLYMTNPDAIAEWKKANPDLGYNLVLGGYSKMDRLASVPVDAARPKTVILAPHHSIGRDGKGGVALSNFIRFADFLLRLPEMYPAVRFVFRPHPLLFPRLESREWWGKARTDAYRAKMLSHANVEFQQGGDYFAAFANSDALIHDCGSFLAEYFYTGKPQCCVLESEAALRSEFTDFGRELVAWSHPAFDEKGILDFIDRVVVGGDDADAERRRAFAAERVCLFHPHASKRVASDLKTALAGGAADKAADAAPVREDPWAVQARKPRFVFIYKVALMDALKNGRREEIQRAGEAYLEAMRAANGFYEHHDGERPRTTPLGFLEKAIRVYRSVAAKGFGDGFPPIGLDGMGRPVEGQHRLAACAVAGESCKTVRLGAAARQSRDPVADIRAGRLSRAVENYGVRKFAALNPGIGLVVADCHASRIGELRRRLEAEGGTLWHWRGFGKSTVLLVEGRNAGGDEARRRALLDEYYPDLPFPDWTRFARSMRFRGFLCRVRLAWLRLSLPFLSGRRRRKADKKVRRARSEMLAPLRLAKSVAVFRERLANGWLAEGGAELKNRERER